MPPAGTVVSMLARPSTLLVLPTATTTLNVTAVSEVLVNVPEKDQTPSASGSQTTSVRASLAMAVGSADADCMLVSSVASTLGPGSGAADVGRSVAAADAVAGAAVAVAAVAVAAVAPGVAGDSTGDAVQPLRARTPTAIDTKSGQKLRIVPPLFTMNFSFGNQGLLTGKILQTEIISGFSQFVLPFDRDYTTLCE